MGLFKKNDELFEIMSKRRATQGGGGGETSQIRRRLSTTSVPVRRPASGGFGPRVSSPATEPDLFELDGDALVIVDDGWADVADDVKGEGKTFAIRSDTLVVGAFLTAGLIAAAFLFGRSSADLDEIKVAVVASEEPSASSTSPQALPPPQPMSLVVGARSTQPIAQNVPRAVTPTATPAPATPRPRTRATHQATTVPASAPRAVARGKYVLAVCTTRPKNALKLAKWLNTAPKSPIFGRGDLEAYSTRNGVVRIRGFAQRESRVLSQIKATNDPLGGSGTFHTAYYKKRS